MTPDNEENSNLPSNKSWCINNKRVLVIPDIHQKLDWALAIIEKERGNYDYIVFLGDFFDSFDEPPKVASVAATAFFIKEILEGKYGPNTIIFANHDCAYAEAAHSFVNQRLPTHLVHPCPGYTNAKGRSISAVLSLDQWRQFQLFVVANGYLITHAGLRSAYWRPYRSDEENLDALQKEYEEHLALVHLKPSHIFANETGPLWSRPEGFKDELPLPQIFGHTFCGYGHALKIGRSSCIDGCQSTYALIAPGGNVEIKAIDNKTNQEMLAHINVKSSKNY